MSASPMGHGSAAAARGGLVWLCVVFRGSGQAQDCRCTYSIPYMPYGARSVHIGGDLDICMYGVQYLKPQIILLGHPWIDRPSDVWDEMQGWESNIE